MDYGANLDLYNKDISATENRNKVKIKHLIQVL